MGLSFFFWLLTQTLEFRLLSMYYREYEILSLENLKKSNGLTERDLAFYSK